VTTKSNRNEECKALLENHGCVYHRGADKLLAHPDIRPGGNKAVWDIEDFVSLGKSSKACPYFAARAMVDSSELIFCPYNYLLDPSIRRVRACRLALDVSSPGVTLLVDYVNLTGDEHQPGRLCGDP